MKSATQLSIKVIIISHSYKTKRLFLTERNQFYVGGTYTSFTESLTLNKNHPTNFILRWTKLQ